MQRIRVKYSKSDDLKFVSHSELIRAIEKAIRRSDIPVSYSQGFNPHIKADFGIPLQIGVSSCCELLDIYLEKRVGLREAAEMLNKALPPGIEISEMIELMDSAPSIQSAINASVYKIIFNDGKDAEEKVNDILASKEIIILRKTKSGEKRMDIRPLILGMTLNGNELEIKLRSSPDGTLKVSEFISLLEDLEVTSIKRTSLLP